MGCSLPHTDLGDLDRKCLGVQEFQRCLRCPLDVCTSVWTRGGNPVFPSPPLQAPQAQGQGQGPWPGCLGDEGLCVVRLGEVVTGGSPCPQVTGPHWGPGLGRHLLGVGRHTFFSGVLGFAPSPAGRSFWLSSSQGPIPVPRSQGRTWALAWGADFSELGFIPFFPGVLRFAPSLSGRSSLLMSFLLFSFLARFSLFPPLGARENERRGERSQAIRGRRQKGKEPGPLMMMGWMEMAPWAPTTLDK